MGLKIGKIQIVNCGLKLAKLPELKDHDFGGLFKVDQYGLPVVNNDDFADFIK